MTRGIRRLDRTRSLGTTRRLVFGLMSFDPIAFCDESYCNHAVFVVAGYLAPTDTWATLEFIWNDVLNDEGLGEFHACDCQQGHGEFQGWSMPARQRTCRRFIEVIRKSNVLGVVTAIDLRAYDQFAPTIKRFRHPGYDNPYYLAFQHQAEEMAEQLAELDEGERLEFVFDETKEHQGRAKGLYDSLKQDDPANLPFISRLGSLTFADSRHYAGLQAADLLAYEAHRYFRDIEFSVAPGSERWQMALLRENKHVIDKGFNYDALQLYVDVIKAQFIIVLTPEQRAQLDAAELEVVPEEIRRGWSEVGE